MLLSNELVSNLSSQILGDWSFFSILPRLIALYLAYEIGLTVYYKTLHPLAKFPGPWFATAFSMNLHQCYYDVSATLHLRTS
jgi:hypothetical protein